LNHILRISGIADDENRTQQHQHPAAARRYSHRPKLRVAWFWFHRMAEEDSRRGACADQ